MSTRPLDQSVLGGIQNRLVIAFLTVTTIPVVVLSIYGSHSHLSVLERVAFDAAASEAGLKARKLQDALGAAHSDLFYLSQIPSLDTFIEVTHDPRGGDVTFIREKLAKQFETFVASRVTYRATAYLDGAGQEVVRVERTGTSTRVVPATQPLVTPAHRDLLSRAENLLVGQTLTRVYVEGSDRVGHLVTRLSPRGPVRRGFVLLEIPLANLWEESPAGTSQSQVVIVDEDGKTILGDSGKLSAESIRLVHGHPGRPAETESRQIVTYIPIELDRTDASQRWGFFVIAPSDVVFASLSHYRLVFTLVLLLTLAVAAGMSVLLARQFTVPLKRLYGAAQDIGRGKFDVDLEDHTGDEIGGLARELRAMADKLKVKQDDLQQQIDQKTRELLAAERLSTIGTMSAAIAHEVNNPLGVISMYSDMLAERVPEGTPEADKLLIIAREARRISVLVRGLLQFARRADLNVTAVDLSVLIREAVSSTPGLHDRSEQIAVCQQVASECPVIEADADQLGQVLRNLISNAIHAMPERGTLTLAASASGPDHVEVRVQDSGRGIEAENLPKLFEPFFSTRRFGAGTGLGLAICKDIVERHGGVISVTSAVGEGTTFTIRLPRKQVAKSEAQ